MCGITREQIADLQESVRRLEQAALDRAFSVQTSRYAEHAAAHNALGLAVADRFGELFAALNDETAPQPEG